MKDKKDKLLLIVIITVIIIIIYSFFLAFKVLYIFPATIFTDFLESFKINI